MASGGARLMLALLFACTFGLVLGEVTVLKSVQTVYDRSPKLRIKGTGFDAEDHDIVLELGAVGQPSLRADKDFLISKDTDGDGIILKLLSARRYGLYFSRHSPHLAHWKLHSRIS